MFPPPLVFLSDFARKETLMPVLISSVQPSSPAARAGISGGDVLLSINQKAICDVLDYRFYMVDRVLSMQLTRGGKPYEATVRKGEYEEPGMEFETYLMDRQHACKNKCIFCFVDQMPPGMRESLYFKDDDSRMSFLFGNYITLTNLTDADIDRLIEMRISPINVSVHTTDPALRVQMMKNPAAGDSLRHLRRLAKAGNRINTQLVLVPGYNDGEALERTLCDLEELLPALQSIACVPVGLTRHRQGLSALSPFDQAGAQRVIDTIDAFAARMQKAQGARIAYPSDEFFLRAQQPIPAADYYGDFDQLENGVGLLALLENEFAQAMAADETTDGQADLVIATGMAALPFLSDLANRVMQKHPGVTIAVRGIENRFFGDTITVAGLVTGQDLLEQLAGIAADRLLLPSVMLRREGDRFLDDITPAELEEKLGISVIVVDNDGWMLYDWMTGKAE